MIIYSKRRRVEKRGIKSRKKKRKTPSQKVVNIKMIFQRPVTPL